MTKMLIKESLGDRIYLKIIKVFCVVAMIVTLYPFIYVVSMSISAKQYVISQSIWLLPRGFSLGSYKLVFENPDIWTAYYNTLWYVILGTSLNVIMTMFAAYPLSRKRFFLRNHLMVFISFTMFFSGGLIPSFILIKWLGLYNTRWVMVIPAAVGAWYVIIARQYLYSIPDSIHECATIDGAGEIRIMLQIFMPLCKPILAVLTLFYAVGHWNQYFAALIYLSNKALQPIQLYLVKVLIQNSEEALRNMPVGMDRSLYAAQLKYAVIIVTILPILTIYPFLQKYFVKGVMIGAIKG